MIRRYSMAALVCAAIVFTIPAYGAEAASVMDLPQADRTGGAPLMRVLSERKSTRSFTNVSVSRQDLSNILWAAWGFNRSAVGGFGKRTVPTALNRQNMEVYAALDTGVWRYNAEQNQLEQVSGDNFCEELGAPLTLIYAGPADAYAMLHAGSMYQNAALYCASAGLGNVVRSSFNSALAGKIPLPSGYGILITQSIGTPE